MLDAEMAAWSKPGRALVTVLVALAATACGGGGSSDGGSSSGTGTGTGTGTPDKATRIAAAQQTAAANANCAAVSPFYYEIGDKAGAIASGSIGGTTYTATTVMNIASASKLSKTNTPPGHSA